VGSILGPEALGRISLKLCNEYDSFKGTSSIITGVLTKEHDDMSSADISSSNTKSKILTPAFYVGIQFLELGYSLCSLVVGSVVSAILCS
jgi:hypothetical protein